MYALIELGKSARTAARKLNIDASNLTTALEVAEMHYLMESLEVVAFSSAIRALRSEIRKLKKVPQSKHQAINRFPTDPLF